MERDHEELKQALGLDRFEGRDWKGFHHHASPCIAAHGLLMLERLCGKKTPLDAGRNIGDMDVVQDKAVRSRDGTVIAL